MVVCNKSMEIATRLGGDPPPPPDLPLQKTAVAFTQTSSAWGRLPPSMEINGNQWKSIEINGNQWKSMEINGNQWKSMEIH